MMCFGLKKETLEKISGKMVLIRHVDQAIIFGSRAKGTQREGSDIDITLKGEELDGNDLNQPNLALDELDLPYLIDLSIYHHIHDKDLKGHIQRVGKIIFSREDQS